MKLGFYSPELVISIFDPAVCGRLLRKKQRANAFRSGSIGERQ